MATAKVVQSSMARRSRSIRLMACKKRYECGWVLTKSNDKAEDEFKRELEVGSYEDAKKWLDGGD